MPELALRAVDCTVGSFVFASWLAGSLAAQEVRLSGALAATPEQGTVSHFAITPDGARGVFRVDAHREGVFELWSAPMDGSTPSVRLSPAAGPDEEVDAFVVAEGNVFFRFGSGPYFGTEGRLYVAPVDRSAPPRRLDGTPGGEVVSFVVAPDGLHAVYTTDASGTMELFLVPANGSAAPLELGDGLGEASGALFTPDGARVLANLGGVLWSFALDGSGAFPIAVNHPLGTTATSSFTSDGAYLVSWKYFSAVGSTESELHSARLDGSAPAGHLLVDDFDDWRLFSDEPRALVDTWSNGLRIVPLDGSAPLTLHTPAAGSFVTAIALSPDDSTAYFGLWTPATSSASLLRVPTDGSAPATAFGGTWRYLRHIEVTPDQATLLVQEADGLWAVPSAGGTAIQLSSALPTLGLPSPAPFELLPDGVRVLYRADRVPGNGLEAYVQAISGLLPPVRIDLDTTGDLREFQAAGGRVAYLSALEFPPASAPVLRLFGVPDDASTAPVLLSDRIASGAPVLGDVTGFVTSHAGRVALFRADGVEDQRFELYAARVGQPRRRLDPQLATDTDVHDEFALSADETRAAFWTGSDALGYTLWCARTDGSVPPVALATAAFTSLTVSPLRFSRDGAHVLFRPGAQGFASVPSDGSAPPTPLGPAALSVTWFEVDEVGNVVFLGNLGGSQLHAAPVDASAPATLLAAGGSAFQVQDVALHGAHAWFRADPVDNVFELVRVPIAGGSAEVMSAPLVVGGDVAAFAVAPSGTAVYLADGATDARSELFRVLGPGSAVLLSPMPAAGDVNEFVLDAAGARVVFTADALVDNRDDLFSVPADGSAAPLLLATDPGLSADLRMPVLDPAGANVAYGVGTGATYALRRVPAGGGASLAVASFVREHRFTADSRHLVYWSDPSTGSERIQARELASGRTELLAEGPYDATSGQGRLRSFELARNGRVFVHGAAEMHAVDELFLGVIGAPRTGGEAPGDGGTILR